MLFHPIFKVLIRQPDLLVEHAAGYVALVQEEMSATGSDLAMKAAAWGATGVMGLVFVIFSGIAVMLGAVVEEFHWALVVVPALPLAGAIAGFMYARTPLAAGSRFDEIKAQARADMQALRVAGEN